MSENQRRELPNRREHTTWKAKIAGKRTIYISVHEDENPGELFLRVKGVGSSSEVIGLYDVIARLASLCLQFGAPMHKVADMLFGAKFEPAGPVTCHESIRNCTSLPDLIGRHLLIECCGRRDLSHGSHEEHPSREEPNDAPDRESGEV